MCIPPVCCNIPQIESKDCFGGSIGLFKNPVYSVGQGWKQKWNTIQFQFTLGHRVDSERLVGFFPYFFSLFQKGTPELWVIDYGEVFL